MIKWNIVKPGWQYPLYGNLFQYSDLWYSVKSNLIPGVLVRSMTSLSDQIQTHRTSNNTAEAYQKDRIMIIASESLLSY